MDPIETTLPGNGQPEPAPHPGRDLPPPPIDEPPGGSVEDQPPIDEPPRSPDDAPAKIA